MVIEPQYTLPLVYQLVDANDTGTYYVQAVIRNSLAGAVIQTTNLIQGTGGRFVGSWLTSKDPTGLGFFVDITTTVYTDAGYSVKSDVYQRETNVYLLRKAQQSWGSGGGAEIDYDKVRKILKEEIKAREKSKADFSPLISAISDVHESVRGIKIPEQKDIEFPEQKEVDLSPVLARIDARHKETQTALSKKVDGIKIPEKPDLSPVLEAVNKLQGLSTDFKQASESATSKLETLITDSKSFFTNIINDIQTRGSKLKELMKSAVDSSDMPAPPPVVKSSEPSPFMKFLNKPKP